MEKQLLSWKLPKAALVCDPLHLHLPALSGSVASLSLEGRNPFMCAPVLDVMAPFGVLVLVGFGVAIPSSGVVYIPMRPVPESISPIQHFATHCNYAGGGEIKNCESLLPSSHGAVAATPSPRNHWFPIMRVCASVACFWCLFVIVCL